MAKIADGVSATEMLREYLRELEEARPEPGSNEYEALQLGRRLLADRLHMKETHTPPPDVDGYLRVVERVLAA